MADIDLKNSAGVVIGTVDAAEWASMPEESKAAFMAQFEPTPEPPTQRLRAIGQGLTLGFGDELAAAARAPFGSGSIAENYASALEGERGALKQYRENYPIESTLYEVGGAVVPAIFSGGAAAPVSAARAAGALGSAVRGGVSGAKMGAAYGFGSGEGGFVDRAANLGVQGAIGGVAGGALGAAGSLIKGTVVDGLVNWVRNKTGDRMAGTVAREVQRLAEQGGMTADEVVENVAKGRLMAENRTLESMIRKFYSEGGPAGAEIKTVLSARPAATREAAMQEIQGALGSPGNPLANKRASDVLTRKAENEAYESAFKPSGVEIPAPDDVVNEMADIAVRAPGALKAAAEVSRVKYGTRPFFTEADDGTITFTRMPTLRDAELVYRSLRDMKGGAYNQGQGTLGGAFGELSDEFKGLLDIASPALGAARSQAAEVRGARDAFVMGQGAARKSPDELALMIQDVEAMGADAVAAFREGLLTSIRAGLSKPSAAPGLMRGLADETTGPGTALRMATPAGTGPRLTERITTAENAQRAYNKIIEGSQTAQTALAPSVGGGQNIVQDVASGMGGDLMAWARLIGGLADNVGPKLSDAQRLEVAKIVLSEDPKLVLRALTDNTMVGKLQGITAKAVDKVVGGATRGTTPATRPLVGENRR